MWVMSELSTRKDGKKVGYAQKSMIEKRRLSVDIDDQVLRLAKSKAAIQGRTLTAIVDTLLRGWVNGTIKVETDGQGGK